MAKVANFVQEGRVIDYTAGDDAIDVGDVVALTTCVGVALEDIAAGAKGSVQLTGVWTMPAVNDAAFGVGDQLYWDATNSKLTKTATDNISAGVCVAAKGSTVAVASVKIG